MPPAPAGINNFRFAEFDISLTALHQRWAAVPAIASAGVAIQIQLATNAYHHPKAAGKL